EVAKLDADYQQQLAELEALRAELKRLEETPAAPAPSSPDNFQRMPQQWSAKSTPAPAATTIQASTYPSAYRQPTEPTQYGTPTPQELAADRYTPVTSATARRGAPMPAGINFIPNTAYPDSRGYTGLDQLVGLIRQSTSVLEIRVHTPTNLPPRAAQLLSEERAITIRNFLVDKGISTSTFKVIGFGNNLTGEQGERVEVLR
ncbi:MAG: OmpA family protein, partial [Bacteroidota bacterium]